MSSSPTSPDKPRAAKSAKGGVDNYELIEMIGQGKRTRLWRARDWSLKRNVAIKEILDEVRTEQGAADQFWSEATFFAGLKHPGILRVLSIDKTRGWMIMELADGSLTRLLGRPTNADMVRSILRQGLEAIGHIHERGRVHGGIKPANLLYDKDGKLWLADSSGAVSEDGVFRAPDNFKYLAPELLSGEFGQTGPATDLYCLGFTALELLMGPGFESQFNISEFSPDQDWARWHNSTEELPEFEKLCPGAPEDVALVVGRLLRKSPAERYASAADALTNLAEKPLVSVKSVIAAEETGIAEEPQDFASKVKRFYTKQPLVAYPLTLLATLILFVVVSALTEADPLPDPTVRVITEPPGATITIDDRTFQTVTKSDGVPYPVSELAAGMRHKVKAELAGYQTEIKEVDHPADPRQPSELKFILVKTQGAEKTAFEFAGRLLFAPRPPKGLLYGQLSALKPQVRVTTASNDKLRDIAQIYWRISDLDNPRIGDSGFATPDELASQVISEVRRLKRSVRLQLGVGLPETALRSLGGSGLPREVAPDDDSLEEFVIGFQLPKGVRYDPDKDPDVQDPAGRWYAVVQREADGARLSVFWDEALKQWWFVDQHLVSVQQFVDRFLPGSSDYYLRACRENQALIPDRIKTYESMSAPIGDSLDVDKTKPEEVARLLAAGPFLYNPKAQAHQRWHRGYADSVLGANKATDAIPEKDKCPGGNTDSLPVIGIAYIDALAYKMWIADKTDNKGWRLCSPQRWKLVTQKPSDAPLPKDRKFPWPVVGNPRDKVGLGAYGLWYVQGNLIELGDKTAYSVPVFGTHFSGTAAIKDGEQPFYRSTQYGFRLHLEVPLK